MNRHLFLGSPDRWTKAWIEGQPVPPVPPVPPPQPTGQFNFLYKKEGDTEWQEWETQPDDIQVVDEKVTIKATSFKAMDGFADVREVKLPNKWNNDSEDVDVTSIGEGAFSYCRGLTSVTIPDSVSSIGTDAFRGCSGITAVHISNLATWCKISFNGSNANPLCYAHNLYLNGSLVVDLEIPDGVTNIGDWAFYYCTGLESVTIPDSVISIGNYAFNNCEVLTSIVIPDSVTNIGEAAFSWCGELANVTIGSNVTSIGPDAFLCCIQITSIIIPDSVETIGNSAFVQCNNIEQAFFAGLTLAQVKAIPDADGNLQYPWGLDESMIVPGVVEDVVLYTTAESPYTWRESIPQFDASTGTFSGFAGKESAVKVIIPRKVNNVDVTSIGGYAFRDCSGLTSVTIPNSVTSIGEGAFLECSSLVNVTISDSVMNIGSHAFYYCSALTSVTIPDGVKRIESAVFKMCSNLTNVTIPATVMSIGDEAFADCSGITSMTIPNRVTSIGTSAFYKCTSLTSVEFEGDAPLAGSTVFVGVASGCKAVITSTATGFPAAGKTWMGLIVEVKS